MVDSFDIFGGSNFIDEIIYKNELNFNIWSSNLTDVMKIIILGYKKKDDVINIHCKYTIF
jgi:hypothetical protein